MKLRSLIATLTILVSGLGMAASKDADIVLNQIRTSPAVLAEAFTQSEAKIQAKGHILTPSNFFRLIPVNSENPDTYQFQMTLSYKRAIEGPFGERPGDNGYHVVVMELKGNLKRDESGNIKEVLLRGYNTHDTFQAPNGGTGDSSSAG